MYECPLCNGLTVSNQQCKECRAVMADQGKVADYFDDYSPYLDDAIAKLIDGAEESATNHTCSHLFVCNNCGFDQQVIVEENEK
ncbi:hypothetical protein [Radiobacillus sp. PE A8.2]|uniref:hypothetical protein n=1 Tax=Radiobacillus sp. PE A8.2 TaxID=3380349 RepID=UPI00389033DE